MIRWLKFNAVGVGGATVQLCALWLIRRFTALPPLWAVTLAVEIAILQNFCWHEAWTWPGLPVSARWKRLARFHAANGFVSIVSNVVLTYLYADIAGLPLITANLAAIVTAALLNFWVARAWVFRAIAVFLLIAAHPIKAAVITTTLQPATIAQWNNYIAGFERGAPRPPLTLKPGEMKLIDLHAGDVPDGYIHHWLGAQLVPNSTVASFESALRDYDAYPRIYSAVKLAEARKTGPSSYDVRLITERVEPIGLHFAFDIHSRVEYRRAQQDLFVESRSYQIRESDSGHAPFADLMPEGKDHGILWRLNSYWRLRQMGSAVYAECQAISLSRRPLFGSSMQVSQRAKDQLAATLRQTNAAAR